MERTERRPDFGWETPFDILLELNKFGFGWSLKSTPEGWYFQWTGKINHKPEVSGFLLNESQLRTNTAVLIAKSAQAELRTMVRDKSVRMAALTNTNTLSTGDTSRLGGP